MNYAPGADFRAAQANPAQTARASWPLIVTTAIVMLLGAWLPFSPIGPAFGFTPLPPVYWPLLAVTLLGYALLTQSVKTWLFRQGWVSE